MPTTTVDAWDSVRNEMIGVFELNAPSTLEDNGIAALWAIVYMSGVDRPMAEIVDGRVRLDVRALSDMMFTLPPETMRRSLGGYDDPYASMGACWLAMKSMTGLHVIIVGYRKVPGASDRPVLRFVGGLMLMLENAANSDN